MAADHEAYKPALENLEARQWFQEARVGLCIHYYSPLDWHHTDYYPVGRTEVASRRPAGARVDRESRDP